MSFLSGSQLSTYTPVLKFVYTFIFSYPGWAGIKVNTSQTKNGIKTNFSRNREWKYKNIKLFVSLLLTSKDESLAAPNYLGV